jgi:2-polyprenyl-6-methoxyphenol hydroxylase-like FAD-dependent oxidoreductase
MREGAEMAGGVLVVGAGIAGLAASLLLARSGRDVTLIERFAEPAAVGAGIMLQPNGLAVLEGLGLANALRRAGRPMRRMEVRDDHARILGAASMPDFGGGLDHYVAIHRADLHRTLVDAVLAERRITPRWGATVLSAHQDGTVLLDGGGGYLTGDLVIGADGIGSAVRSGGSFGARLDDLDQIFVRALVTGAEPEIVAEYWTPLGVFGAAPLKADVTYCYAAAYRGTAAVAMANHDVRAFAAAWRAVPPLAGDLLGRVADWDAILVNGIRTVRCERWVNGRLVLVGDAVHAMAPNVGQGANSALADVAVLAEELVARPTSEALNRCEARRRPPVTRVQSAATRVNRVSDFAGTGSVAVRNRLVRLASLLPGLMERQIRAGQQIDPVELRETVLRIVRP